MAKNAAQSAAQVGARPLEDRRYLPRGPIFPYRGGEVLLLLFDLFLIFFGIKFVETIHTTTKGNRVIAEARAIEEKARKEETEMITSRTARRDSLEIIKNELVLARHADSLRIAVLDTLYEQVSADIAATAVEISNTNALLVKTQTREKKARKGADAVQVKLTSHRRTLGPVRERIAAINDTIRIERAGIVESNEALQFALSQQPDVVVPKTSSASIVTQVQTLDVSGDTETGEGASRGDLLTQVSLGRAFFSMGKTQLGLKGHTGFGTDRTSLSGAGLFFNLPVIPNRASLDIGSGAAVLVEADGGTRTSPYLSGTFRYSINPKKKIFLLGDSQVSHDRLWTGVGIGLGRR